MEKQQKETRQLENDYQGFIKGLDEYLNDYRNDSAFVDSFCSARDKYNKAVNSYPKNDTGKTQKRELLEKALKEAKKCLDIDDDYSQWINPNGLITAIEQEISKL